MSEPPRRSTHGMTCGPRAEASRRGGRRPRAGRAATRSILATTAVVLAAGCGGGGGAKAKPALPLVEFISRADAVCRQANAQYQALKAPRTTAELGPFVARAGSILAGQVQQLKALTPPAGEQSQWATYLKDEQTGAEIFPKIVTALQAGDTAGAKSLLDSLQTRNGDPIATGLGLSDCAKNVQPHA